MIALIHTLNWLRQLRHQPHRRRTVEAIARRLGASRKQAKRIAGYF